MGTINQVVIPSTDLQDKLMRKLIKDYGKDGKSPLEVPLALQSLSKKAKKATIIGYQIYPVTIDRAKYAPVTYKVRFSIEKDGVKEVGVAEVLCKDPLETVLEIGTVIKLLVTKQGNYDVFTY